VASELRRKLHQMGYHGYRDYFLNEHIRPKGLRRASDFDVPTPVRSGVEPAVLAIVILACIVLCFAAAMIFVLPLQWLFS
jgi:hypothetical protein